MKRKYTVQDVGTCVFAMGGQTRLGPSSIQTRQSLSPFALTVEPGTQQLDVDNLTKIRTILSVCAGLVIVDEQLSVVRLVHYTT
jgi:hypothetical protein